MSTGKLICLDCGELLSSSAIQCPHCTSKSPFKLVKYICRECGKIHTNNSDMCLNCGNSTLEERVLRDSNKIKNISNINQLVDLFLKYNSSIVEDSIGNMKEYLIIIPFILFLALIFTALRTSNISAFLTGASMAILIVLSFTSYMAINNMKRAKEKLKKRLNWDSYNEERIIYKELSEHDKECMFLILKNVIKRTEKTKSKRYKKYSRFLDIEDVIRQEWD